MKLWGGRFAEGPSKIFEEFSGSLDFDKRLFFADVEGSRAWVSALQRIGIYTAAEAEHVRAALAALADDARGDPAYFSASDEDVHTLVQRKLGEKPGMEVLAARLHTGRSRNEQVGVDVRLWMKQEIDGAVQRLDLLLDALVAQAEAHPDLVLPGYTHLRRAQPVVWGHYLMAYFEMFARDRRRLLAARDSADAMPLGDRKSTRLNSSHIQKSRMPSSA